MNTQDLEQRARDLLDAKHRLFTDLSLRPFDQRDVAVSVIADIIRHQPAPVDLEQFREAVEFMQMRGTREQCIRAGDMLQAIIDKSGKVASAEPVAYCEPSNPFNSQAFVWNGTDREARHSVPLYTSPHQPAPVVDDARMARALEWVRDDTRRMCSVAARTHLPAIEEAIAAYDPNCGARTVRVVDDGNGVRACSVLIAARALKTDKE